MAVRHVLAMLVARFRRLDPRRDSVIVENCRDDERRGLQGQGFVDRRLESACRQLTTRWQGVQDARGHE